MTLETDRDEREMLRRLGIDSVDALFADIPESVRHGLDLPEGMGELEVHRELRNLLGRNRTVDDIPCFLGGDVQNRFVPPAVDSIVSRSEFYTSYTPYQPEASQGMLQALFEYQSFMCELTGMDAANTSMYDGVTALGEACLMASRINQKRELIVPRALGRGKRSVLDSYARGPGLKVKEVGFDRRTGKIDLGELSTLVSGDTSAVYVESPNHFGVLEESLDEIRRISKDCALIVGVDPLSLAVLRPPGDFGADIVVGEGQSLGLPMGFGGPLLGLFACRGEHVRRMPGRIAGMTKDVNGRRAFCLTLQTREQHIRRGKATSNICTNQSLCAVASAVFMSLLGRRGLRRLALRNMETARAVMERIDGLDGFEAPLFDSHHFNQFVARSGRSWNDINARLLGMGIQGGLSLEDGFPELGNACLMGVTEQTSQGDVDRLVRALEAVR